MKHGRAAKVALIACMLLIAASSEAATLVIEWDPPTDGVTTGYILWGGTAPGQYSHSINVGLVTSFEIAGLPDGATFYFAVQSYSATGEVSPLSEEVSGTTWSPNALCSAAPGTPSFVASAAGTLVSLSWAPGAGEAPTGYILEAGSVQGSADIGTVQYGAETTSISTQAPPGTYWLRLSAVNACGTSPRTPDVAVVVEETPAVALPGAPTSLRHRVISRAVTLTWSPPVEGGEPARYVIEVRDRSGNLMLMQDIGPVTAVGAPDVPPGHYVVSVHAANAAGVGPASNSVTVRVQ